MHRIAKPFAAKPRASKLIVAATGPALLVVLLGLGAAATHDVAQGPAIPTPISAPADTSWGGPGHPQP